MDGQTASKAKSRGRARDRGKHARKKRRVEIHRRAAGTFGRLTRYDVSRATDQLIDLSARRSVERVYARMRANPFRDVAR